jgi:hypothetical protein
LCGYLAAVKPVLKDQIKRPTGELLTPIFGAAGNRAGAPIINSTVSALRFFFTVTLGRADAARHLTFVHEPRKLPVVLSPEEVARLLEAAPGAGVPSPPCATLPGARRKARLAVSTFNNDRDIALSQNETFQSLNFCNKLLQFVCCRN